MLNFKHHIPYTKINRSIILLIFSDMHTWGGYLVMTFLAGLYLETIFGNKTAEYIGIGSAVFFITKAIMQIPVGILIDKIKTDKDEILLLALGSTLIGLALLAYPLIFSLSSFVILQLVLGLGYSFNVTSWRKMFAKNVDEGKEGREYSIYDTIISFSTAILTALAGTIASRDRDSFSLVFLGLGIFSIIGAFYALALFLVKRRKAS
ncbi:MAG: MFS transporter [bacterium]